MENSMSKDVLMYQVDAGDTIVCVSDNWASFAEENNWAGEIQPNDVVGHTLWRFIQNEETRHLYQILFKRTREGNPSRPVTFRCDSPGERRFLELKIEALAEKQIKLTSRVVRTESRPEVNLLNSKSSRSTSFITICSMCKKIKTAPGKWVEIEEGLEQLKIFEAEDIPQLTHGLCEACFKESMQEIERYRSLTPPGVIAS